MRTWVSRPAVTVSTRGVGTGKPPVTGSAATPRKRADRSRNRSVPASPQVCATWPGALISSTRTGAATDPTEPWASMPWKRLTKASAVCGSNDASALRIAVCWAPPLKPAICTTNGVWPATSIFTRSPIWKPSASQLLPFWRVSVSGVVPLPAKLITPSKR